MTAPRDDVLGARLAAAGRRLVDAEEDRGLPGMARSSSGQAKISRSPVATCPRFAERWQSVLSALREILGGPADQAEPSRDAGCPSVAE